MPLPLRIVFTLTALVLTSVSISCATRADEPVTRAMQFLTNVHTGKIMKTDEWLTLKARSEPAFKAHGGLDAMVKQSTARAERYGGLKSVEVLQETKTSERVNVRIKILFNQSPSESTDAPNATKEEMIWDIAAEKEDSNWKLSF